MIAFIFVVCVSLLMGIQIGIYSVLKMKSVTAGRSFIYSFMIYILPFCALIANIKLVSELDTLIKDSKRKFNLSDKEYQSLKKNIRKSNFISFTSIFSLKYNLKILIETILEIDKKVLLNKEVGKKSFQQDGVFGILAAISSLFSKEMKDHAQYEVIGKRYAH
ncbi:hypothetical protein [Neobacillus mesonae]|uniref:hypothetical protein n=1 Tax=Neobacillus mesonae TaxID=1193713 RepID=UPI002573AF91|nr:hypothetical protein [Neobacillus mesonae]